MSVSKGNHGKYSPLDDVDDATRKWMENWMNQIHASGAFNPQPWQMPTLEDLEFDKSPDKFEVTFQMPVMDPESIKKIFLTTDVGI